MDLADGSLRDRLKACRKAGVPGIPPQELLGYLGEAAEALDYLHASGVLHRDIKPDNILLFQGHARLADFGLARMLEATTLQHATLAGTPAYMAPEVWRGLVNEHSDQYSLAASYVELRLSRGLFPQGNLVQLMQDHAEHQPDLAPLPAAEREVLLRAVAKEPGQRYATCREFHQALARALAPAPVPAKPGAPGPAPPSGTLSTLPPGLDAPGAVPTPRSVNRSTLGSGAAHLTPGGWHAPPPTHKAPPPAARRWRLLAAGLALLLFALGGWAFRDQIRAALPGLFGGGPETGPQAADYVPPHCVPDADGDGPPAVKVVGNRALYEGIAYVLPDGTRVPFVLVPKVWVKDPDTFYIMRDKVTRGVFREFVKANPNAVPGNEWQKPVLPGGAKQPGREDEYPVYRVTFTEARQFARWLGGDLPTARQWDKAAGAFEPDRGPGPFRGKWDLREAWKAKEAIAVNRGGLGPLPAGKAYADVSAFRCRDMAGNGFDWTRTFWPRDAVPGEEDQLVPADNQDPALRIWLRGHAYTDSRPYTFEAGAESPTFQDFSESKATTGFRVVLELPATR
jgi:hypothetical protein